MKKIQLLLLLFTFNIVAAYAQVDYLKIKKQNKLSCTSFDDKTMQHTKELLDPIHAEDVINGKREFLYDKGMLYYTRFAKWKKQEDFLVAEIHFNAAYEEFNDLPSKWNLMLLHYFNNDCQKAIESLNTYLQESSEILEKELYEINLLKKNCLSKSD